MHLVLIFGVFNPVTNAHIEIGQMAKERIKDADILYIPAKTSFMQGWKEMKANLIMNEPIRLGLLKESIEPYGFHMDTIEIDGYSDGKTYNTIQAIKQKYNTSDITLCMGDDKLGELHRWYKGDQLLSENKFLIFHRNSNEDCLNIIDETIRSNFTLCYQSHTYEKVSSTLIRNAYIDHKLETIKDYVPECVYTYLSTHKDVYKGETDD